MPANIQVSGSLSLPALAKLLRAQPLLSHRVLTILDVPGATDTYALYIDRFPRLVMAES